MTGRVKLKGKHKRGERGSVEEEQQIFKRANMADEEEVWSANDKEPPNGDNEEVAQPNTNTEETSLSELKEMLVDIQITISDILRQNSKLTNEVAELRNAFHQQKTELTAVRTTLAKAMKQQDDLETELVAARKKISDQEEEIAELFDLQDELEQYTRKNSLEIHGIPESAYTSTEEVVLKLAGAVNVDVNAEDIEISHKLNRKGVKPIIVKFQNHKVKSRLYKARTKLKNVRVSDIFPFSTAVTRVASERIYLNENLTSYRRELLKQANQKRKDGLLNKVTTAVNHFVRATEMVNSLALFSRNEELSEVPTSELRFFLLPAFLGDLFLKQSASDRMTTLNIAKVYFIDYLKRCKNYGVTDMDLSRYTETSSTSETKEKSINQMANSRQEKITRYKEQKEQERQLKELKNLLNDSSQGDEDIQRNYYVVLLKLWVNKIVDHLTSMQSEMEILEHMKVLKRNGSECHQENKPPAAKSQQSFKPILITREMIKDKVFGAGYPSVPTMSQEELLEKEILEAKVVLDYKDDQKRKEKKSSDEESESEDDPGKLQKKRDWDEWKDDHRRGWGNRENMG